ncbi:AMP-binding protein [Xenorhabdus nematophila]|uniref:AMP-binding protein n=1 Tax=Xenorhabdus nematophila TaxID=628 RepID=UPI0008FF91FA
MKLRQPNALISYDELNRRANRLAHHLIALGVQPDDRVAICLERSPKMVVGILAILKLHSSLKNWVLVNLSNWPGNFLYSLTVQLPLPW